MKSPKHQPDEFSIPASPAHQNWLKLAAKGVFNALNPFLASKSVHREVVGDGAMLGVAGVRLELEGL